MTACRPRVTVVVPVYCNAPTLVELTRRVHVALSEPHEILFVDDASPDDAADVLRTLAAADPSVSVVRLRRNCGQHHAILAGLAAAHGELIAVMDADLQDPPEALTALLEAMRSSTEVVFAGRRGRYESRLRLTSAWLYRGLLHCLTGAPRDAAVFCLMRRDTAARMLSLRPRYPSLVVMIACSTRAVAVVPVERSWRNLGTSGYSAFGRLQMGLRMLACVAACRFPSWAPLFVTSCDFEQEIATREGALFTQPD